VTYRVDLEIPRLTRLLDVDNDLFVVKACLLQGYMGTVRIGAAVVGVEDDLRRNHCWSRSLAVFDGYPSSVKCEE